MSLSRLALTVALVLALFGGATAVRAQAPGEPDDGMRLADFVERRAASTSFAALERFGREAMPRTDREGLN
ncbi:MAG: hypothetical protein EON94_09320, partial [Caulobacteraceae bacterium]